MNEWMNSLLDYDQRMESVGFFRFLIVMTASLLCSLFICLLYTKFYRSRATGSQVYLSFPLLGISITGIFICIQFSLPLSLGLLGALSIVRFRTPIKEPEEIGFIMLLIATSLCTATFNLMFLGIILFMAVVALLIINSGLIKQRFSDGMLVVTLPTENYQADCEALLKFLKAHLPKGRLAGITEGNGQTIVSYSFPNLDMASLPRLQTELKKIATNEEHSLFFNRSSEV